MDASGACQSITWSSHKSTRMCTSTLGIETVALADAFDVAYSLKHDIQRMMGKRVPITVFPDSLSLFAVITKAKTTLEKRLVIDIECLRKAYKFHDLEKLGFIRSEHNPADVFMKLKSCPALDQAMSGILDRPIE